VGLFRFVQDPGRILQGIA